MNAPNRFALFVLAEGEKALEIQEDTKIPNAATVKVVKQDHTLANMIRAQLLANPCVLFAGYKVPHPLEPYFLLKIQTDGSRTPTEVLKSACQSLIATTLELQKKFKDQFALKELDVAVPDEPYGVTGGTGTGGTSAWGEKRRRAEDYLDF
ncbi:hypothetical protein BOTBODRAFT_33684 [Botryobasidium botryosum FD-172 SS1]|uniref:DNA-directed RNA polymerase RBP11-like dimerisation domain-containing protein n=1 Tax=Botryobasidium botryosum (strain FD-172 SS1) TaxID=930990 RepID=A0A067MFC9_BOTB1|nr:hypothetical protein BOTBODRAFT_33684 [Botryobasidium botryosum FD-172 SS1]